ncbi:hypothetical protein FGO68_gene12942 [Halteria grandinella]|uniref:CSC1/OSCA1-like 7TM region domain-containing protein n=1 Tax=Halteria grandinella TaxID=5974 RepID=A0A8J8NC48_HALGN|nr:hypothetical protein FGO68_gene12942 [Halteria grandinella]
MAYFSPWLALEKRKIFTDSAPWRRKEELCFQYGFFYAQMMTVFAIAILFSSTVPFVTLAACLFYGIRHLVDCLQLLTFFRREVDSSGRLISTVTNTALLTVILYQLCMMAFFIIKKRPSEAAVTCLIMVASTFYTVIGYEEVYDLGVTKDNNGQPQGSGISDENGEGFVAGNDEAFKKWRAEYEHPLVIGNVRRKANTLGIEVKTVNDWLQFIEDKEVQGILFAKEAKRSGIFQMSENINTGIGGMPTNQSPEQPRLLQI